MFCDVWARPPPRGKEREGSEEADCRQRPSAPEDPLIAIITGTTTRKILAPSLETIALTHYLLPSVAKSADCGFNYLVVLGYDVGDQWLDTDEGRRQLTAWFEDKVAINAAARGINIRLDLLRVDNKLKKPGPVFNAVAREAYEQGAMYFYRVNDDSEFVDRWASKFVSQLQAMGPPYGVVGPHSSNKAILVHDFTHRTHMDIFAGEYYPPVLAAWYMDDWISRVYGAKRTVRAQNFEVIHHTSAHGQRYQVDYSVKKKLTPLVKEGSRQIAEWMAGQAVVAGSGVDAAAVKRFKGDFFDGRTAQHANAKDI